MMRTTSLTIGSPASSVHSSTSILTVDGDFWAFLQARRRAEVEVLLPKGVKIAFAGGVEFGGFFAFVVAYVLFPLMFLLMLADTILTIVRTW